MPANYVAGGFGPTNMSAAKHAFVPTTCNTCHEAGLSFYLGASTPPLQGRPADHTQRSAWSHRTTAACATRPRIGTAPHCRPVTCPIPADQACTVCHIGRCARQLRDAREQRGAAHRHHHRLRAMSRRQPPQLTFYNNNDNPKAAVLTPPHIPAFTGTDCSNCHAANYVVGGFGPMNMTQATHAGRRQRPAMAAMRPALVFYMGAASPGSAGPAGRSHHRADGGAERLQPLPHHGQLEQHGAAGRPHAQSGQPGLQRLPHDRAERITRPRRWRPIRCCTPGISSGCGQCHGGTTRAHLVQQLHAQGCGADAAAHSLSGGHRLRLLPHFDHVRGRQPSAR